MPKFKVGDRVIDPQNKALGVGEFIQQGNYVILIFENYDYGPKDEKGHYKNYHLRDYPDLVIASHSKTNYRKLVELQDTIYA